MSRIASTTICFCFILSLAVTANAKQWRGIVPLHSKRADVRRLMGKPLFETRINDTYDLAEGRVTVRYARGPCEQGLPADWGNWNVLPETVVNITITLELAIPLGALKIKNIKKYKWYTDNSGATYYRLRRAGVEYQVQERKITGITFGPTLKDSHLLCKKNVPEIRY